MISPEFSRAVKDENLILTRIMLKDSLIVDTSFTQFDEMLFYAKRELANLTVPYDGKSLENDSSKWNVNLMNIELVELINNFSEIRIEHLKKVINVAIGCTDKSSSNHNSVGLNQQNNSQFNNSSNSTFRAPVNAVARQALNQITSNTRKIKTVMDYVENRGQWNLSDIEKLKDAANQMLSAIEKFEKYR